MGQPVDPALRGPGLLARGSKDGARRDHRRPAVLSSPPHLRFAIQIQKWSTAMHFHDDALFPENQEKLVITCAPYGPEWEPEDFRDDLPLTMEEHVQQAVNCYEAGATVLHIHVRELDGKGSKRLSKFNELLGGLREAVPDMILQIGGSISFAPEGEGTEAKWLSDDTRHMLAELDPKPDQVTIAINTSQMNIMELMTADDIAGTSMERPELAAAYREMTVPAGPEWVEEHLRRLQAAGIQPHFQLSSIPQLETVERLIRRGVYTGPLNLTWVGIGGGFDGPNPYNIMNFIQRVPDGACLSLETLMRSVLPVNAMAIAMGLHTRCGNEDTIWGRKGQKMTSAQQVQQLVRVAKELGREVATGKEARDIYKIGTTYANADETLSKLGYAPSRLPGQVGFTQHA
ncbi:3-keto-5-aminohexanoate cleavage protein [Saccharopolyspora sp. NPDC049357]|uniref:3-keto-5-aminohexanoate cleavage protein n=1 Tax=Saccharopolyspora sp. NPDC049357 TaxID=3154507 RepID=UPI0034332AF4